MVANSNYNRSLYQTKIAGPGTQCLGPLTNWLADLIYCLGIRSHNLITLFVDQWSPGENHFNQELFICHIPSQEMKKVRRPRAILYHININNGVIDHNPPPINVQHDKSRDNRELAFKFIPSATSTRRWRKNSQWMMGRGIRTGAFVLSFIRSTRTLALDIQCIAFTSVVLPDHETLRKSTRTWFT